MFWVERRDGGVWRVGRAVNPQLRQADDTRPEDILFEGYELDDALTRANEALEDDARVIEDDRGDVDVKPFTRKEVLPLLERFFFGRVARRDRRAPRRTPGSVPAPCGSAWVTAPIPTTPSCTGG